MSGGHTEVFRTHASYLDAFAMLCSAPYRPAGESFLFTRLETTLERLAPRIVAAPTMASRPRGSVDPQAVRTILANAWGTEFLLAQGAHLPPETETMRIVNNWAVVQSYYASYHAAQALIVARGERRPETHPATQRQFASMWADRGLDLPPWTLGQDARGPRNVGTRTIDDGISSWTACDSNTCWHLSALALRTTRDQAVDAATKAARERKHQDRKTKWKTEERAREAAGKRARQKPSWWKGRSNLTPDERAHVARNVRTYTVLDYLYRLRIRANYGDAEMMLAGPEHDSQARALNGHLTTLSSATLLLHELHVGALVGRATLLSWADSWLAAVGSPNDALGGRIEILRQHLP